MNATLKIRPSYILMVLLLLALALLSLPSIVVSAVGAGDNCCHLPGRNCQTDSEWHQGFWDFVNHQCLVPEASNLSTSAAAIPTPASPTAETWQVEQNCCYAEDWNCPQNDEGAWARGYYAYHHGECDQPERWDASFPIDPAITDPFEKAEAINEILSTAPHLGERVRFPSSTVAIKTSDGTVHPAKNPTSDDPPVVTLDDVQNRNEHLKAWDAKHLDPEQEKATIKLCLDIPSLCPSTE